MQDAARGTLPVLMPRKEFVLASAENKSTYNSTCAASSTGYFSQEKCLRKKLHHQLQKDRIQIGWTSRVKVFEKAWEYKNPQKTYALLKQYYGKTKRCSPFLNSVCAVAVGETSLPIWRDHLNSLLKRQAPSVPQLVNSQRPTFIALNVGGSGLCLSLFCLGSAGATMKV
ncbi:hypothetical protein RB195_012247 [Necator americanus]|uniref:Uncharacterized protein n=1 Tax=Necator americanus TaxID=51031 RepID=A0ABR1D731_NECAM